MISSGELPIRNQRALPRQQHVGTPIVHRDHTDSSRD
jgi:hypothetical protein